MNAALGPMFVTLHTSQNGHAEDQRNDVFVTLTHVAKLATPRTTQ